MTSRRPRPTAEQVHQELRQLRHGEALAHPGVVRSLSQEVQDLLLANQGSLTGQAEDIPRMIAAIRRAIDTLSQRERLHAQVEFNLLGEHHYPTLGQRQESLASVLGCTAKTVRRSAARALDTLALLIATGGYPPPSRSRPIGDDGQAQRRTDLSQFWGLHDTSRVDIVCSELPADQRAPTAEPGNPHYMRYGQFADLDALFYVRVRLARTFPRATIHDFATSEHYDADADTLIVIGSPKWNSKHREFLPDLPIRYDTGSDSPQLIVSQDGTDRILYPRMAHGRILADLTVITRLTIGSTTVFLLAGCLSLGTSGAAKCFLHDSHGAANARYVTDIVGDQDFIMVTETHRIGSIIDPPSLNTTPPLLILSRTGHSPFHTIGP